MSIESKQALNKKLPNSNLGRSNKTRESSAQSIQLGSIKSLIDSNEQRVPKVNEMKKV